MTSFIIDSHVDRKPSAWNDDPDCAFCRILKREAPAAVIYETDMVIAILDILPLREGHALVIPKAHYSRLSELPEDYAAAVGAAVSKVANALTLALDNTGLNVVCNQEYAQAVPHVHYHIIPARFWEPRRRSGREPHVTLTHREMHQMEYEAREELDYDDAALLLNRIRSKL
ncbi:HIT-like protein [Hymenopellis radicata]|nr:HIT-like protein [Hymenopellis radicata]